jgi:PHD/YefM family antitoxin component YafN of YafNO toxin-antitoxin module
LPSGSITVLMSEQDFESYKATNEMLGNPARAEAIRQELTELEK